MIYSLGFLVRSFRIAETNKNSRKTARLKMTIVAPTGMSAKVNEVKRPETTQNTDTTTEVIITVRNLLHRRMDVSAGKIIIAEISSVPSIRIPTTMVIAVSRDMTVL